MAFPTRTTVIETFEGKSIVCAKFTIVEANTTFKFKNIVYQNTDYQFQLVAKANSSKQVTVTLGGVSKTVTIGMSFMRETLAFTIAPGNTSPDLVLTFPVGVYYLYNLQLEKATSPSDWRPAPEDETDYADDAAKKLYYDANNYADLTAEQKAEAAVEAQTQLSIFNKLTNNGQVQGLYLQNGRIYLNATYIQTGTLSIKKGNLETFYANADTGTIRIVADEFSLSNGTTLASTLASSKSYTDTKDSATRSYIDAETQETKEYALDAAASAVNAQTQASIFNKLTNNGQTQGIYLTGGKIYLNAAYMATGVLADANGNMAWNLATGALSAHRLSIDSPYFKLTEAGAVTATSGSFNNIEVKSGCNLAPVSSQVVSNARSDIEDIIANKVTANYIEAHSAVLGKMYVGEGGLVGVNGPLVATTIQASRGFIIGQDEGTSASIKLGSAEWIKFNHGIYTGNDVTIGANTLINILDSATNKNVISEWYVSRGYITLYEDSNGYCSASWRAGTTARQVYLTNIAP